jgi:putative transposase
VLKPEVMARCIEILENIAGNVGLEIKEASGEPDHVHLLLSAKPDFNLCRFINSAKTVTSRLLKKEFPEIRISLWKEKFWSASYFVVTAGGAPLDVIKAYIENQGKD